MNKNPSKVSIHQQERRSSEGVYDDDYMQNTLSIHRLNQECCFINFSVMFFFIIGIYVLLSYDPSARKNVSIIDIINDTNLKSYNETLNNNFVNNSYNETLNDDFVNNDNLSRIIFDE